MRPCKRVLLALLIASGCVPPADLRHTWEDWRVAAVPDSLFEVRETPATCSSCLMLETVMKLDIDDGEGMVDESQYAALSPAGKFYVGSSRGIQVYAFPSGEFIERLGRNGSGPGEFRYPGSMFIDESGRLHMIDLRQRRQTAFDSSHRLAFVRALPSGPTFEAVMIGASGDSLLLNSHLSDADRFADPLHVWDGTQVTLSFGLPRDSVFAATDPYMRRQIARIGKQYVLSIAPSTYDTEVYSLDGTLRLRFTRPGLWSRPESGLMTPPASFEEPMYGYVQDVKVDQNDRAWIVVWEPHPEWRERGEVREFPGGERFVVQKRDAESLHVARIDVIDLGSGEIVASQRTDLLIWGFIGNDFVYGYEYNEEGAPVLVVQSVRQVARSQPQ